MQYAFWRYKTVSTAWAANPGTADGVLALGTEDTGGWGCGGAEDTAHGFVAVRRGCVNGMCTIVGESYWQLRGYFCAGDEKVG